MKKFTTFIIAAIIAVCLCSCDDGATGVGQGKKGSSETAKATESTVNADSTDSTDSQTTATTADSSASLSENGEITVTENMYVTYINEIYTNYKKYEGYKITIEGMYTNEDTGSTVYHYVYRTGPGCCGNDGAMCGFEFTTSDTMPKLNDWIRVSGTLRNYEENGMLYLTLDNSNVEILDESQRGAEVVG